MVNYLETISKDNYNIYSNKNYLSEKKPNVTIYENCYVLPVRKKLKKTYNTLCGAGGLVSSDKEYIESSQMDANNMLKRLYGSYDFDDTKVEYINESVIYINHFIHHWGHYLLDVINRLWYIIGKDLKKFKFVYIVQEDKEDYIKGNYLELLNLLGIDENQLIMINKVTQFKEVILPNQSLIPGKNYTREYKMIFNEIIKNSKYKKHQKQTKIFCSRSQFNKANKKEIGGEIIESIFLSNGYKSISFEKLTVKEQIEILNNSSDIVAFSGTLSHNILFVENETHVTILNKTYALNMHQFIINQISMLKIDFVDVHISPMPILYGFGPFIISVTNPFIKYCKDNRINLKNKANYRISIKNKIWFYTLYLISYKFRIPKDNFYNFEQIRKNYKYLQKREN